MTKAEKQHKQRVSELGCSVCMHIFGNHPPGEVELHHLRSGGWGKGDYKTLMPLCYEHHRGQFGIHGMGTKAFEKNYGITQQELLTWTTNQLSGKPCESISKMQ